MRRHSAEVERRGQDDDQEGWNDYGQDLSPAKA